MRVLEMENEEMITVFDLNLSKLKRNEISHFTTSATLSFGKLSSQ
jgi:hypothetical protein